MGQSLCTSLDIPRSRVRARDPLHSRGMGSGIARAKGPDKHGAKRLCLSVVGAPPCQHLGNVCHRMATCNDTSGSAVCTCRAGYTGTGKLLNGCAEILTRNSKCSLQ